MRLVPGAGGLDLAGQPAAPVRSSTKSAENAAQSPAAGALLLFRMRTGAVAKHCGIQTAPDRFIHAYERSGVVEAPLDAAWRWRVANERSPSRSVISPIAMVSLRAGSRAARTSRRERRRREGVGSFTGPRGHHHVLNAPPPATAPSGDEPATAPDLRRRGGKSKRASPLCRRVAGRYCRLAGSSASRCRKALSSGPVPGQACAMRRFYDRMARHLFHRRHLFLLLLAVLLLRRGLGAGGRAGARGRSGCWRARVW